MPPPSARKRSRCGYGARDAAGSEADGWRGSTYAQEAAEQRGLRGHRRLAQGTPTRKALLGVVVMLRAGRRAARSKLLTAGD